MAETAVGWIVSPVISLVINKIKNTIEKKYFKQSGIEKEMTKMNTSLLEIHSIMEDVEKQRIVGQNKLLLVREIKDAVYDAEDVVDEFQYNFLEEKSKKQSKKKQKKVGLFAVSCSNDVIYQVIVGHDNFKKKAKEVTESLDQARRSAKTLQQLMNTNNSQIIKVTEQENQTLNSSLINEKFIGRENERELLINFLFEKINGPPTIIPIVGQAGVGKSTLAQMVVNDRKVQGHFDQIMWLTISDSFDKLRLTKEMLKYVCESFSTENAGFDMLQTKLKTELAFKKILLVLDDVWYVKDHRKSRIYEQDLSSVLAPLSNAKAGSKIVVTTRQNVVSSCWEPSRPVRPISLHNLNYGDSWSLFEHWAFDDRNQHSRQDLKPIGKKIISKLKGLALAIRVVGRELRGNSNIKDWEMILHDNSLDKGDIFEILLRSYEHLPEHLQRCFAYCSLFPKDFYLKPNRLVYMWIAQGFVHPQEGKLSETVNIGQSYFNELIDRSFIQVIIRDNKKYYVMHDLMNDLACYISRDECYVLKKGDPIENMGSIRHLSITAEAIDILGNIHGLDKLRTLIILPYNWMKTFKLIDKFFIKLKRIRVLDIGCHLESLLNFDVCKHLRYLCFQNYYFFNLPPDSFSKLHHLAVLIIRRGTHVRLTLPQSMCNMSSLVSIHISKSIKMDAVERVRFSRFLTGGSVLLHVREGLELGVLQDMNDIKGSVEIDGLENVVSGDEAKKAQLSKKELVTALVLHWSASEVKSTKHHEVLESLRPNPSMERLEIYGYQGEQICPSCLDPNSLLRMKVIVLKDCNKLEKLPVLGQLTQLKELVMKSINAVSRIGIEFYGDGKFPNLEKIEISDMISLEEWLFPCGVQSFPKLQKLEIHDCPRFVGPECDGFPALQELEIRRCDAVTMKVQWTGYGCLSALTILKIAGCKGIINLEKFQQLVSLRRLEIKECPNLVHLPKMEFFYSLMDLCIENCPNLRSLPKKGLPVSLQELVIVGTHPDLQEQIQRKNGREWDKITASGCLYFSSMSEYQTNRFVKSMFTISMVLVMGLWLAFSGPETTVD